MVIPSSHAPPFRRPTESSKSPLLIAIRKGYSYPFFYLFRANSIKTPVAVHAPLNKQSMLDKLKFFKPIDKPQGK
jgi:hypothetical protein